MTTIALPLPVGSHAWFSPCRTWRYWLTRDLMTLHPEQRIFVSIGLNPSTADEYRDDPTIRRDQGFARLLGFSHFWKLNLFAFRATDPRVMKRATDPVGPDNLLWILRCAEYAHRHGGIVLAAWGAHGDHADQAERVVQLLRAEGVALHCLGRTKDGHPRHPLYVPYSQPLEVY